MSTAQAIPGLLHHADDAISDGCVLRSYHSIDDLDALRPAWDTLLSKYGLASTFSTWEWLTSWWRAFGANRRLLVLALFDRANSLVGLAPLSLASEHRGGITVRVLRMMGDGSFDSDNLDMPAAPGFEQTFGQAIFDYLKEHRSEWDLCSLNTLPPESPVAKWIANISKSRRWTLVESTTHASAIHLPGTWEEYLAMLSSEDSKNIPRYTRRLQNKYATRIYRCDELAAVPGILEALFQLHQGRWESVGGPGSFSSPQRREFYQELSASLLKRGCLELWVLEVENELVAVQFAFRYRDRVFQLQEGYDHNRSSDRFGYVLRAEALKTLINEGVRVYDFLGGEDSYKTRWAASPGCYRTLKFAPPLTKGGLLLQISNWADSGKEWARRRLPPAVWSLLKKLKRVGRRPTQ